jgi:UDP:flavonoid glycosyltransferase YjiC (YdhE family)
MESQRRQLHLFFFPFLAQGHMIPAIDMAKLFASKGLKISIVTTPLHASQFSKTIEKGKTLGFELDVLIIEFPCVQVGLPNGCESFNMATSPDLRQKFLKAMTMLEHPLGELLQEHRPDCLVASAMFPWATVVARKFGIPRLSFHATSFFSICTSECLRLHEPHKNVSSDSEPFIIPNFPDEIKLTRKQLPDLFTQNVDAGFMEFYKQVIEAELTSYGAIFNSFYELEPAYADYYKRVLGRNAWHIGPVSLCNKDNEDKAQRGKEASIHGHECLKWLNSKEPNSVVYVCFGSMANFNDSQLMEIAMGLEASQQQFIWVVKREKNDGGKEEWLPEGFEKRVEGKGLIIRGWAPQVLILDHEAVGGFVTHCGWNSTLEGVAAGVPMVTWPVSAEQFYNEKLVTQVLRIGVGVGAQQWVRFLGDSIRREAIEKGLLRIMVGEEAEEMRSRARELGKMANRAVEEGGSSYSDLNALIDDLRSHSIAGEE